MPRSRKPRSGAEVEPAGTSGEMREPRLESREEDLREELSSLAALGRAKDDLLNRVAHDLRARLGTIFIWLTVLRTADEEKAAQAMDVIETSSRRMADLLNELQDVMSVLSGRLMLDKQALRLGPVVEAAANAAQQAADARGIRLERLLEPVASLVSGDALRLQQVVGNLISNALKFTPENGQVCLRLEAIGRQARLSVIDTGQGISQELLPLVFERAPRPEIEGQSRGENRGLGLAIAHELVRLHGGTLEVSSEGPGQGSTFTVTLPLQNTVKPAP